jgi:hypothetical protein
MREMEEARYVRLTTGRGFECLAFHIGDCNSHIVLSENGRPNSTSGNSINILAR